MLNNNFVKKPSNSSVNCFKQTEGIKRIIDHSQGNKVSLSVAKMQQQRSAEVLKKMGADYLLAMPQPKSIPNKSNTDFHNARDTASVNNLSLACQEGSILKQDAEGFNSLDYSDGYKQDATTLTGLDPNVVPQLIYEADPARFVPILSTQNPWADEMMIYSDKKIMSGVKDSFVRSNNITNIPTGEVTLETDKIPMRHWERKLDISMVDVEQAKRGMNGGWDYIHQLRLSVIQSFASNHQQVVFEGLDDLCMQGLYNLDNAAVNIDDIYSKSIGDMTAVEFDTFSSAIFDLYMNNTLNIIKPNTLIIGYSEFNKLLNQMDTGTPVRSKLSILLEKGRAYSPDFEIKTLPNGDLSSISGLHSRNKYRLVLYNNNERYLRHYLGIGLQQLQFAEQYGGYYYGNISYARMTGLISLYDNSVLYLDHTP